jgi:photosystem II stability/assembly factor-like uncharacterized protein
MGADKGVNFLYVEEADRDLIYAACISGLFFSRNQGRTWQRIYQGGSKQEANCLRLIKLKGKELYLGTEAGLFKSGDNGQTWYRFSGSLGNLPVRAIAAEQTNRLIYLATPEGLYQIKPQGRAERIFVSRQADLENENEEEDEDTGIINYICIDPNRPQTLYLATNQGIFKSKDSGVTWRRLSDFGLLSREVRFITVSADSNLWALTKSGVFRYSQDRWQEISLRLPMQDIRFLTIDHLGNIYVAGDKGLFRGRDYQGVIYPSGGINEQPSIRQVQRAAIKYAEVIDPKQISAHRRLCRLRAILPDFSLDYDKTIYGSASTGVNGGCGNVITGPRDWGFSLKWSLDDLIWSEQQRLIDSQVRLMVKLRQDILDEVTRLYFERRRLQSELISSQELRFKDRQEKELRIEELSALLDGLTGGYLSKFNLTE